MGFKVGDKVERIRSFHLGMKAGDHGTVSRIMGPNVVKLKEFPGAVSHACHFIENLKKIGGTMYKELKERIEVLDDGWNKEADDILQELQEGFGDTLDPYIAIAVPCRSIGGSYIRILKRNDSEHARKIVLADFEYNTQCEKHEAFKKALLWLLDHSYIAKEDKKKTEKIAKLQEKIDKIQEEINNLKD